MYRLALGEGDAAELREHGAADAFGARCARRQRFTWASAGDSIQPTVARGRAVHLPVFGSRSDQCFACKDFGKKDWELVQPWSDPSSVASSSGTEVGGHRRRAVRRSARLAMRSSPSIASLVSFFWPCHPRRMVSDKGTTSPAFSSAGSFRGSRA